MTDREVIKILKTMEADCSESKMPSGNMEYFAPTFSSTILNFGEALRVAIRKMEGRR